MGQIPFCSANFQSLKEKFIFQELVLEQALFLRLAIDKFSL